MIFDSTPLEIAHDDSAGHLIATQLLVTDEATADVSYPVSPVETDFFPVMAGTLTGYYDWDDPTRTFADDGSGNIYHTDDPVTVLGTINYETGHIAFTALREPDINRTMICRISYTATSAQVGTIDYVTGEWTYTGSSTPATANYRHGEFEATFDYATGIGQFTDADLWGSITALSVTYTGYHNKCVRVTFTDPTMKARWYMTVSEAASYPAAQVGKMLVLGRMKVSDGSTICRVQLASGFAGTSAYNKKSKLLVSGEEWRMYALGQVMLPETGRSLSANTAILNQRLTILAERYAGTGTLDLDCLIMIPLDEGFISVNGNSDITAWLGPVEFSVRISRGADERISAAGARGTDPEPFYTDLAVQATGGFGPGGNVYIILAAQRVTGSFIQDEVNVALYLYRRWLTLRGAE